MASNNIISQEEVNIQIVSEGFRRPSLKVALNTSQYSAADKRPTLEMTKIKSPQQIGGRISEYPHINLISREEANIRNCLVLHSQEKPILFMTSNNFSSQEEVNIQIEDNIQIALKRSQQALEDRHSK